MTSPHEPAARRLPRRSGPAAVKLLLSFGAALVFLLVLRHAAYVDFPRQVAGFKDGGTPSIAVRREFQAEPGPEKNIWVVELTFAGPQDGRRVYRILLNGDPIGSASPAARSLLVDFPGSRLVSGLNVLEIRSAAPWTFRRLRVKNIYGYSSGSLAGVLFHRDNRYPEASRLPLSSAAGLGMALFFILAAGVNAAVEIKAPSRRGLLAMVGMTRYLISGLLLAALALPVFSRFRIWFDVRSLLVLALIFYGLAFIREWLVLGTKLLRGFAPWAAAAGPFVRQALGRPALRSNGTDLLSWLLIAGLAFLCLIQPGPVVRSGDSLEYVAMLVSWAEFGRPYVTSESIEVMERRLGQAPAPGDNAFFKSLKERFPSLLKNGAEMDLPHFWLYSLAASVFYHPARWLSLNIGLAFMLLHLLVVLAGFLAVRRALGRAAGLCLLLIILGSPLVWFVNKVHVELISVILACAGAALLEAENWAGSALFFGLASAQNPPFAILAGLVFLLGFIRQKWTVFEGRWLVWVAAFGLAAAQPAYYLLRLGILNPVVATGAAKMDRDVFSLRRMFSFLVDPDIGLFTNWPVALALVLLFAFRAARKRACFRSATWIFIAASLPVLLWSQSRSLNLNHGGTYLISRYALWYLYIFFLVLWQIGLSFRKSGSAARRSWLAAGVLAGALALVQFWPSRPEEYLRPTRVSEWLYSRIPGAYDPMPEIFTERYRRIEENLPEDVWAVSNPSGSKILVRRGRMQNFPHGQGLVPIPTCPELDELRVYQEAERRFEAAPKKKYLYINGLARELRRPDIGRRRLD
ncbi:MAG: hypothetical protein A2W03_18445 [Candidatus Aminicenantes bacterium RBG_16_63_16]|nr:MAG: hypothetical protein A2W03_18445 [Candidatus Aminicenantes bacterium RBG_16_63_16]